MADPELSQEATSIAGAWMLDLSRSDNFEGFLQLLGHSEEVVQSQVDGEREYQSLNVIALDEARLAIYKDTAVNRYTERLELDQEQVRPRRPGGGFLHIIASLGDCTRLDGFVIASTIVEPGGQTLEILDTRQLLDGGHAHTQFVTVCKKPSGEQVAIRRAWVRVAMPRDEHMRLLR